ncbi:MAG: methyl-accepting chemotaxis protein, partial [Methanospirillum sp.]|uniref:methyl-accepting chemotaxis protein n=1 Tax=Methanospirillum sp. TaxID=45200 RepID=UPI0023690736
MTETNQSVVRTTNSRSLQAIIDAVPVATLIIGPKGQFIDCNKESLRIFHATSPDDIIGKLPGILSPPKQRTGKDSGSESLVLLKKAHETGSITFYWDHVTLQGTLFPARVTLSTIRYDDEPCLMVTITDMTDQVRAEENNALIQENPYALLKLNPDLTIADVNPAFLRISGYKKEEWIGRALKEFKIIRRDGPTADEAIRTKTCVTGKIVVDFPNGIKHMQYSYVPVFDADGNLILIYDIFADLSELFEKIHESDSLIAENPASIISFDPSGQILSVNPSFLAVSHMSEEVLLSKKIQDFKILEREGQSLADAINSKKSGKGRLVVDFDWAVKVMDFVYIPVFNANGDLLRVVAMYIDISDQVAYVEEIGAMIRENPHAILMMNPDLSITEVNPAFLQIMGYSYDQALKMKLSDIKVMKREGLTIKDSLESKKSVHGKIVAETPAGIKHLNYIYIPILDKKGTVVRFIEIFSDLTELMDMIAYYESILDAVPFPIHVTDLDMKWKYMNKTFEQILVKNKAIKDRCSAYGAPCSTANASICKTDQCGIHQLRTSGKNETFFDWMGSSDKQTTAPILNMNGDTVGYVETVQDMTEQIRLIEFLQKEVNRLSQNFVQLSEGNFTLDMQITESDKYSEQAKVMFEAINQNIGTLLSALQTLIQDTDDLARKATQGDLKARADVSRHKGEFRKIVEGLNRTLESVIEPVNEALRVSTSYSRYDFSDRVSPSLVVIGDWIPFKEALNNIGIQVSGAVALITKNVSELAASAEEATASIEEVVAGAQQIATNAGKVSQNADQGGDGISQVLRAMEDLNETVGSVSRKAESVSVASNEANSLAKSGIELAMRSEKAMGDITVSAEEVDSIVGGINAQMDEIGKIVRLISDIASQTNLLALNAAIEAARAGDAGRGFAVVAAEVKSLAQDSRKSAENIADMIATLQTKAKQATEAMGKSTTAVMEGSNALEETLTAFNNIAATIEQINRNTVDVASASEEQAASVEEVTASIQEVSNLILN